MKYFISISFILSVALIFSCKKTDSLSPANNQPIEYIFTDTRDGIIYDLAVIGGQTWLGSNIQYRTITGVCNIVNGDSTLIETYGRLYDHEAAMESIPNGWHMPTLMEYLELISTAGGEVVAGDILKSNDPSHWTSENADGTDNLGFTAVGAGVIEQTGGYGFGLVTHFWTSTPVEGNNDKVYFIKISHGTSTVTVDSALKLSRHSVRCIKD